jgi:hypothetical protein
LKTDLCGVTARYFITKGKTMNQNKLMQLAMAMLVAGSMGVTQVLAADAPAAAPAASEPAAAPAADAPAAPADTTKPAKKKKKGGKKKAAKPAAAAADTTKGEAK